MDLRLLLVDDAYPLIELASGERLVLTRAGAWAELDPEEPLGAERLRALDFDAFRQEVEALGGVLPEFL